MGLVFLALEPWAGGPGVGMGPLDPEISLPNFYPPHMDVGPACYVSVPLLPVLMDVILQFWSCQTSIQLNF